MAAFTKLAKNINTALNRFLNPENMGLRHQNKVYIGLTDRYKQNMMSLMAILKLKMAAHTKSLKM
jgi:hypothetical protein